MRPSSSFLSILLPLVVAETTPTTTAAAAAGGRKRPAKNVRPPVLNDAARRILPASISRTAPPPVDYGPRHPFDLHGRRGRRGLDASSTNGGDSPPSKHEPIRIFFDVSALDAMADLDPSDAARVDALRNEVLPLVAGNWSEAISVIPAMGPIVVPEDSCFDEYDVDPLYSTEGKADTDLFVLVSAYESLLGQRFCSPDGGTLAGAAPCDLDQHDRPIIGLINFCVGTMHVSFDDDAAGGAPYVTQEEIDYTVSIAIHEIAHVMGIQSEMLKYYRDANTGKPQTPRLPNGYFEESNAFQCVNGQYYRGQIVPSCNTLSEGTSSTGDKFFEVVTPTVRQVARNQFDCQRLNGARLENQPTQSADCFGSHWDERYYYTETMSAYYSDATPHITPLTLALLEDSGWYKADYSVSYTSSFGHGVGCPFVEEDCISNGIVPYHSEGFFCDNVREGEDDPSYVCDPAHTSKSVCDLSDRAWPPRNKRYFPEPSWGPVTLTAADYCPVADADEEAVSCLDESMQSSVYNERVIPEENYGPDSKCYEATSSSGLASLCLTSNCNDVDRTLEVSVGAQTIVCAKDFEEKRYTSSSGKVVRFKCPRLSVACPDMFCPGNCGGKGKCNYALTPPACECFDETDATPYCSETQIRSPDDRDCSGGRRGGPSRNNFFAASASALLFCCFVSSLVL